MSYIVHTKPGCSYCDNTKVLLLTTGAQFQEVPYVTTEQQGMFKAEYGPNASWPRIYQGDRHIGGYTELAAELR